MKKRSLSVFLLVMCMLLVGCSSQKNISCERVLSHVLADMAVNTERNGQVFLLSADEGQIEYFPDQTKMLMYGENSLKNCFPKIEDCAIYVSAHILEEVAIFKCYSSSDTDEIVKMCLERADMIKVSMKGSSWQEKTEKIRVTVHRHFVVFSFTDDSQEIEESHP